MFATKGLTHISKETVRYSYQKNLDQATEGEKQYYGTDYPDKGKVNQQLLSRIFLRETGRN